MFFKNTKRVLFGTLVGFGTGYATKALLEKKAVKEELRDIEERLQDAELELKQYKDIGNESFHLGDCSFKSEFKTNFVELPGPDKLAGSSETKLAEEHEEHEEYEEFTEDEFSLDFINYAPRKEFDKIKGLDKEVLDEIFEKRPFFDLIDVEEQVKNIPEVLFKLDDLTDVEIDDFSVSSEEEVQIKEILQLEYFNTASRKQLLDKHKLKKQVANHIIKNRPYGTLDELKSVKGLPLTVFDN